MISKHFFVVVPSKLSWGRTSEFFVHQNGLIRMNSEYETVVTSKTIQAKLPERIIEQNFKT